MREVDELTPIPSRAYGAGGPPGPGRPPLADEPSDDDDFAGPAELVRDDEPAAAWVDDVADEDRVAA